ncbi:hypothetical protein PGRAN_02735 [Listeria grandensis FSL F6-0971]|uniref:Uncharacterized protein n=1 Tax=Listeria grandensis FSL F6-0971 TaxID=1265819 RepID=W7BCH4_9LIST|nr:hypothetical protein [Listeria grandensis]EUJ24774.1 hypothetical protein PGRAN_02735 [Listeria grandensis FSL F6-0971]
MATEKTFNQGLPEWQKAGSKPPSTIITGGWAANQKPPADYFNWFFNTTYMALKELQEVADKEFIKRDGTVSMTSALKVKLASNSGSVLIINEGSVSHGFSTAITAAGYIVMAPMGSDGTPDWTKQLRLNRLGALDVQDLTIKGEPIALAKDYLPLIGGEMLGAIASAAATPIQARLPNNIYTWNRGKQADGTVIKVESRLAGTSPYTQSLEITVGSGVGAVSADGNFTIDAVGANDAIVKGTVQFGHTLRYSVNGVNITTGVSVAQYWYRVTRNDDGSKNYLQFGAPLDFSGIGGTIGAGINFVQAYLRFNGRDIAIKDEVLLLTGGELTGTVHTRASIAYTGKVGDIKHYINPQPVGTVIRFELFIDGVWSKSLDITVGDTTITGTSDFFLNPMTNTASYITGIGPLEATKTKATVISTGANTISGAALPTFWWLRILRNFYDTCIQAGKNLIFSAYGNAQLDSVEVKTKSLTQNGKKVALTDDVNNSIATVQTSLYNHIDDTVSHITSSERIDWNSKETKEGAQSKANLAETNSKAFTTSEIAKLKEPSAWTKAAFRSGSGFTHFAGADVHTTISADGKVLYGRGTGAISNPTTAQIEAFTLPSSYVIDFSGSAPVTLQNSSGTARILIDAATKKVLVNISDTNATGVMFSFAIPIKL